MKFKVLACALSLGACLSAQTMSNLPIIVVQPFEDLRTNPNGENYAPAISSMMKTAIGSSLIFQTEGGRRISAFDYQSLRTQFSSAKGSQLFLMTGTVLAANNAIQVDIRVYDVAQESLVYSSFVPILSINAARSALEAYLEDFRRMVFGNILGRVELSVSVPGADVYLDKRFIGTVPKSAKLDFPYLYPGEYSLRILATGYMDYQEKISVRERRLSAVNVQLAQEPGSLTLDSEPSGAEVFIDGKPAGSTPLRLAQIQPGSYRVTIKKELYLNYSSTVELRSREERSLKAPLTIMPGALRLVSLPAGATLYEGDKPIGETPLTLADLAPRKYVFQLQLDDYLSHPLDITIEPAKTQVMEIALSKAQAPVDIYSNPPDAELFREGPEGRQSLGRTPLQKLPFDFGSHRLVLEKEGYFPKSFWLRVDENRSFNIDQKLAQKPAAIRISTDPDNARIIVDGSYRGNSPLLLKDYSPGKHRVEARTSYGSASAELELAPDEEKPVMLSIRKPALSFISAALVAGLSALLFFSVSGN